MDYFLFHQVYRGHLRRQIHHLRLDYLVVMIRLAHHSRLQLKIWEKHLKLIQHHHSRYRDQQCLLHQLLLDNLVL